MATFSSCAGTYPDALRLIDALKKAGISANITAGGVAIHCSPDRVNDARAICKEMKASFDAGFTAHQEDILLRSSTGYDIAKAATDNAIAVIKEWKND